MAPYRPVEEDFVGFKVHFKHDIGQVMILVTFKLTEIVLCIFSIFSIFIVFLRFSFSKIKLPNPRVDVSCKGNIIRWLVVTEPG